MKTNRSGFTLIELTLSIAFIGILLMAVVTVGIALGRTYQRGITLRDVNQSGRQVMDKMRRDIATSNPSQLKFLLLPNADNPETARLCTGSVSYIINLASHLNNGSQFIKSSNNSSAQPARLVRVDDGGGANCVTNTNGQYPLVVLGSGGQEQLGAQDEQGSINLAIHDIDLKAVGGGDESRLYQLGLQIGTNDKRTVENSQCVEPNKEQSNFEYCAVHEFETIIRAGYRSK